MRLSTKSTYSLQALTYLAYRAPSGELVSLKEIARAANLPLGYLEQLFSRLSTAGLVFGKKGKLGGYGFSIALSNITAWDVISAVEDSLAPVPCVLTDTCQRQGECLTQNLWVSTYDLMRKTFMCVTLEQLGTEYQKRLEDAS